MALQAVAKKIKIHPYITRIDGVAGGSSVIEGTRIRVIDIAIEYDRLGYSSDQIIDAHPHLSLKQVHDALSYYYENQGELDKEIETRKKIISKFQRQYLNKMMRKKRLTSFLLDPTQFVTSSVRNFSVKELFELLGVLYKEI